MIPLLLQSHTRPLTQVVYNKDGDLLFSSAKDHTPIVWRTTTGERLGSYNGHCGAVWAIDPTSDSSLLASGSADNSFILWDVECGKKMHEIKTNSGVRSVNWAMGDQLLAVLTDATMGFKSTILIWDRRTSSIVDTIRPTEDRGLALPTSSDGAVSEENEQINLQAVKKPTKIAWLDCNEGIIAAHDDGFVSVWDSSSATNSDSGRLLRLQRVHQEGIRDLQLSKDRTSCITASKDMSSKLVETGNLRVIKTYQAECPINSASISPIRPEVVLAGGQEAANVTTTSSQSGQFESRFFHAILEQQLGTVRGHFGPINTVTYSPDGRGYASGAEDGYIRLHRFDPEYFDFVFGDPSLEEPLV